MLEIANDNPIIFYVSQQKDSLNFDNFDFEVRNLSFNIANEKNIQNLKTELDKNLKEVEKNNKSLFLISNWSNIDLSNCEIFMPFLDSLIKKSQQLNPPGWKRKYKSLRKKTPLTLINAFETTNLNHEFIQQLTKIHQRIYVFQENSNYFSIPSVSPPPETIFPKLHVLPQDVLEKMTKDNLELIVLIFLDRKNKTGYQILKEIAQHFHCILSQGTLYPLLYRLEKENKITKHNGKGREIVYSLTQKTKNDLQLRKETLLNSYQHLAGFLK